MVRWSKKIDFLSVRLPFLALLLFLCSVQLMPKVFITTSSMDASKQPVAVNDIYFWMQLVAFVFIVLVVSFYFEETFRKPSAHYIDAFKIGVFKAVFLRYIRLLLVMEFVYLPFVYACVFRANRNISYNMEFFNRTFELIDPWKPIFQCAVFMLFSVTATLFLMTVLKSKVFTLVLAMAICIMEIRVFPIVFGEYTLFRGAGMLAPDYFSFFPPNIIVMLVLTVIFIIASLVLYRARKLG